MGYSAIRNRERVATAEADAASGVQAWRRAIGIIAAVVLNVLVVFLPCVLLDATTQLSTDVIMFGGLCGLICLAELVASPTRGEQLQQSSGAAFRYRNAAQTGSFLLLIIQWCALLEAPSVSTTFHPLPQLTGVILVLAGVMWRGAAMRNLATAFRSDLQCRKLITSGVHRFTRHPSESGLLLICAGLPLVLKAWLTVAISLPLASALAWIRIRAEEQALLERFGTSYQQYMQTTPRWLPRPGKPRRKATSGSPDVISYG